MLYLMFWCYFVGACFHSNQFLLRFRLFKNVFKISFNSWVGQILQKKKKKYHHESLCFL